ncbi:hypothetical protein M422DRAFT_32075 [Sphaerobolus stellatus SS14]|uniref:Calcineurin-like phosphoesterase domain-containing protein n=1 Tax=Sphaerobolus stellatus (strain SS14) TaxID=990650 RepID=A0A0C9VRM5_SPHS4|nr:hypothetical protein M422DRAFT_32075 [Sphaerobolus stellatus SS14]
MANQTPRRILQQLRSKASIIAVSRLVWVLAVLWWEFGIFHWDVAWCRWPTDKQSKNKAPLRILLIADPQVLRPHRTWVPGPAWIKQYLVNHNLRKSWSAARSLRPQMVIFLGDMLRHGSKCKDMNEYATYFYKFHSIFKLDSRTPIYYVPGNRDVGLGSSYKLSKSIRSRYESQFGSTNRLLPGHNHTLVLLDAPALVEEDYRRHGEGYKFTDWQSTKGGSIEFVKSVAATHQNLPVILFTHIPLWRPEGASCGPLREYGTIRRGVGKGYQSLLGKDTSSFLLDYVRPSIIFSADDHDYCEYSHVVSFDDSKSVIPEITVKSFSMATELRRPGFQMLSLFPTSDTSTPALGHTQCLLPNQFGIYSHGYIPLLILTILLLIILNVRRRMLPPQLNGNGSWLDNPRLTPGPDSVSPGRRSPPISPIHYKMSRSRTSGIRSASTLTPMPSQPSTPLGSSPFLSPFLLSPSFPPPIEEEESQELLIWQAQLDRPKGSPFPAAENGSSGVDSSYFLPSTNDNSRSTPGKTIWRLSRTRLTSRNLTSILLSISAILFGKTPWSMSYKRARTWYGRCLQDITQVLLLPVIVYFLISMWLYL